jgi:hypothetical protein
VHDAFATATHRALGGLVDYQQYCIAGEWEGKSAGGVPPQPAAAAAAAAEANPYATLLAARLPKQYRSADADAYWFNNPQYEVVSLVIRCR